LQSEYLLKEDSLSVTVGYKVLIDCYNFQWCISEFSEFGPSFLVVWKLNFDEKTQRFTSHKNVTIISFHSFVIVQMIGQASHLNSFNTIVSPSNIYMKRMNAHDFVNLLRRRYSCAGTSILDCSTLKLTLQGSVICTLHQFGFVCSLMCVINWNPEPLWFAVIFVGRTTEQQFDSMLLPSVVWDPPPSGSAGRFPWQCGSVRWAARSRGAMVDPAVARWQQVDYMRRSSLVDTLSSD
jgi:hypothetical protein